MKPFHHVEIIAEAGVNHNGSLDRAYALIDAAVESGADVVKFQSFKSEKLVSRRAEKAEYQKRNGEAGESQLTMLKKLELSDEQHSRLIERCRERKIEFLSTPFDEPSLQLLTQTFRLARVKISSGDLTNAPLLLAAAQSGVNIILSSGMANLQDIQEALEVLAFGYLNPGKIPSSQELTSILARADAKRVVAEKVALLHCTSEYPAPFADINLRAMVAISEKFGLPGGLSDHSLGISAPVAAVALGAKIIEKHFTLDKTLPGPDHQASLEPAELCAMVRSIREVELALGSTEKKPSPSESKNMKVARKSLIAARAIGKGETFTTENLTVKRPGTGLSPRLYWDYLGKPATRAYAEDEIIE